MRGNLKNHLNAKGIFLLLFFVSVGGQAQDIDQDPVIYLPMKRILEEGRALNQNKTLGTKIQRTGDKNRIAEEAGEIPLRRTRSYVMTPDGLRVLGNQKLKRNEAALPLLDATAKDAQRDADSADGSDNTAFEEIGAPLDAAHLATFRVCNNSRIEQGAGDLNSYWMSVMSAIAYLKYPIAFERLKSMGFEEIYFIEGASDVEVLVAKIAPKRDLKNVLIPDSGLSVVIFRGTDDAEDWLTNLDATTTNIAGHGNEAWLHEGFALALDEVYSEILKALDLSHNPNPVFITGHSLGGALGLQLAIRLVAQESAAAPALITPQDHRLHGVYVFAVPRVGNEWARNIVDKYMNRSRNVAIAFHFNEDPAPKVPLDIMGYRRFGVQAVLPYESGFGNRNTWACYADADYRGPSAFSLEFLTTSLESHRFRSYAKHFAPWRANLASQTCTDPTPTWGPRFLEENPSTFNPLKLPSQVGKSACDYSVFSWGGNIQL